ncbi:chemotaxis protein CheX [Bacillaceae bacterium S4-13-58]
MTTLTASHTKDLINGTIRSIKQVLPIEIKIDKASLVKPPFYPNELGVLIGITGSLNGQLLIDGTTQGIGKIGEKMYGMQLEGAMLESFFGELGNMFAGNLATSIASDSFKIDITPPTILVETKKLSSFNQGIKVPILEETSHLLNILFMIEG